MVREVGERGHQAGPLLVGERGGELLEALEPGLDDAARDVAAALGDADALHAPVGVVLATLEIAAAHQGVDGAAPAREGDPELLGDLLDGELAAAVGQDAERLDVRHRQVELVEDGEHRLALAPHQVVPEREELAGEGRRSYLRRGICCLHASKYCTRADVFKAATISGAYAFSGASACASARPTRSGARSSRSCSTARRPSPSAAGRR